MIDEEKFLSETNLKIPITIECPIDQCDQQFTGTPAEILIDISQHHTKYHKDDKKWIESYY